MKKVIAILSICTLVSFSTQAQDYDPGLLFGPEVGLGVSSYNQMLAGSEFESAPVLSGHIGGVIDMKVNKNWHLQSGLRFSFNNGSKTYSERDYRTADNTYYFITDKREYRTYALNIPVIFTYKHRPVYSNNIITFGIGPNFGFNYGGRYKRYFKDTYNGQSIPIYYDEALTTGDLTGRDNLKIFNLGISGAVGYELLNGINFKLTYNHGMNNLLPGGSTYSYIKSQHLTLSCSYYINSYKSNF